MFYSSKSLSKRGILFTITSFVNDIMKTRTKTSIRYAKVNDREKRERELRRERKKGRYREEGRDKSDRERERERVKGIERVKGNQF